MRPHGFLVTLVQFALYSAYSRLELSARGESRRIPMSSYAVLSGATVVSMGCANASLGYVNYPTMVVFKSCKLIPVLVGGVLIQGKRYGPFDFAAASVMCVGLVSFTLADSEVGVMT